MYSSYLFITKFIKQLIWVIYLNDVLIVMAE